jgi:hypothetical protein
MKLCAKKTAADLVTVQIRSGDEEERERDGLR